MVANQTTQSEGQGQEAEESRKNKLVPQIYYSPTHRANWSLRFGIARSAALEWIRSKNRNAIFRYPYRGLGALRGLGSKRRRESFWRDYHSLERSRLIALVLQGWRWKWLESWDVRLTKYFKKLTSPSTEKSQNQNNRRVTKPSTRWWTKSWSSNS